MNPADLCDTNVTLAFGPGDTRRCSNLTIKNDDLLELTESLILQLIPDTPGVTVGTFNTATVNINDDDSKYERN